MCTCRKEKLWPHIREFADNGIQHAKNMVIKLAKAHTPCELYAVHGHYADAGEVAALMSSTLGVEMAMTAHSLGRNKLDHLLASGELLVAVLSLSPVVLQNQLKHFLKKCALNSGEH